MSDKPITLTTVITSYQGPLPMPTATYPRSLPFPVPGGIIVAAPIFNQRTGTSGGGSANSGYTA